MRDADCVDRLAYPYLSLSLQHLRYTSIGSIPSRPPTGEKRVERSGGHTAVRLSLTYLLAIFFSVWENARWITSLM